MARRGRWCQTRSHLGLDVSFSSVSCPGAASCLAVGQDSTDGGFIDSWNGMSWTMAFNEQGVSLSAVSCSTPASCVAVGAGLQICSHSAVLVGGTWTAESVPDPGSDAFLYDVSCASPTFCMAVGSIQVGGVGWATGLTEAWDGTSWLVVPSPNYPEDDLGPGFIGGGILISDSCVSAQACVAVGYGGGGVNGSSLSYPGLAVVETWDGDCLVSHAHTGAGRTRGRRARRAREASRACRTQATRTASPLRLQTPDNAAPSRHSSRQPRRRSDPSSATSSAGALGRRGRSHRDRHRGRIAGLRRARHGGAAGGADWERHLP